MKPKLLSIALAALAVALTSTFASPGGPTPVPGTDVEVFIARPDNPSDRTNLRAVERSVERLMELPTTAGASISRDNKEVAKPRESEWFRNPSFFLEYDYIRTNDERPVGPDGHTHSGQIGFDFTVPADVLVGLIYSYSKQDLNSNLPQSTETDSHFVSGYLAKSFAGWLNVGITGGWGTNEVDTRGAPGADFDTWSVTPYFGVFHSWGSWSFSSTATYLYQDANNASTGKVAVDLNVKYALTEKFSISGLTRLNQMVDDVPGEDDNWLTLGGKISYKITDRADIFLGYEYDALNDNYQNHTGRTGFSYSF